jgi:hypothetical protein
VVSRLERERRRLADSSHLDCVVLADAVGNRWIRRVRHPVEQLLPALGGLFMFGLDALELSLQSTKLLELFRRRLALRLGLRTQLARLRLELAPALVRGQQLVELLDRPLTRERGAEPLGVGPRGSEIDQPFVCVR